jgi:pilus assembly protein TadC
VVGEALGVRFARTREREREREGERERERERELGVRFARTAKLVEALSSLARAARTVVASLLALT